MKTWAKAILGIILFFSATLLFAHLKTRGLHRVPQIDYIASDPEITSKWMGKPLVIYFWASWCGICKTYSPVLAMNLKLLPSDSIFISVEEGEATPKEREALIRDLSQFPVFRGNYHLLHEFDVQAFPTTVFLNGNRDILFSDTGIISPVGFWLRGFLLRFL